MVKELRIDSNQFESKNHMFCSSHDVILELTEVCQLSVLTKGFYVCLSERRRSGVSN